MTTPPPETTWFRTPEEVAPRFRETGSTIRRWCRESGHCTRGSKNKILLTPKNEADLAEWIANQQRITYGIPDPFGD